MRKTAQTKRIVTRKMVYFIITLFVVGAIIAGLYLALLPPGEVQPLS
jgi:hypothetical protein